MRYSELLRTPTNTHIHGCSVCATRPTSAPTCFSTGLWCATECPGCAPPPPTTPRTTTTATRRKGGERVKGGVLLSLLTSFNALPPASTSAVPTELQCPTTNFNFRVGRHSRDAVARRVHHRRPRRWSSAVTRSSTCCCSSAHAAKDKETMIKSLPLGRDPRRVTSVWHRSNLYLSGEVVALPDP